MDPKLRNELLQLLVAFLIDHGLVSGAPIVVAVVDEAGHYQLARPTADAGLGATAQQTFATLDSLFNEIERSKDMGTAVIRRLWPDIEGGALDLVRSAIATRAAVNFR